MRVVTGVHGQTIYDLAIQHYGDAMGVDWILIDNPDLDPAAELQDLKVYIRDQVINRPIVEHLKKTITTY